MLLTQANIMLMKIPKLTSIIINIWANVNIDKVAMAKVD